jgi:hypothetical protein
MDLSMTSIESGEVCDGCGKLLICRSCGKFRSPDVAQGTFAAVVVKRLTELVNTADPSDAWEKEAAAEMKKAIHLIRAPAQSVQVTPIAWTNKMQLSFLKDPAYAAIPMAMWGKRGSYADIALYPASQPSPAATVETATSSDGGGESRPASTEPQASALRRPQGLIGEAGVAPSPSDSHPSSSAGNAGAAIRNYLKLWDSCGGSTAVAAGSFADARQMMRDAIANEPQAARESGK